MTNALKAAVIACVNAALALIAAFGVNLTDEQQAAITGVVNTLCVLWIALTYRNSPKRITDKR